ncbi:MAG TPA: CBS domain-containing protein [Gammaproteobacteria bacterium]|nr:CBS domain-containing protein [Gammaproteobacteria bacterium]
MSQLQKLPKLSEVMTPFPFSVDADSSIEDARQMMKAHGVHHLPVKIDGIIDSVISDRDIQFARAPGVKQADSELKVGDFCAVRAYCADLHDPLDLIIDAMLETHIGAVLVFREGEFAGILTQHDALKSFSDFLKQARGTPIEPESA